MANLAHGLVYLFTDFVGLYLREGFALVHTTKQLCKVVVHTHKQCFPFNSFLQILANLVDV